MRHTIAKLQLISALALLGSACVTDDAPCTADGLCLAGFICQQGLCQPCSDGACASDALTGIGPKGGLVCGDDDVCLRIPEGALTEFVDVQIKIESRNAVVDGFVLLSNVYSITPLGTQLALPATVEIPISSLISAPRIKVLRSDTNRGAWTSVQSESSQVTAIGAITDLSFLTCAYVP